MIWVIPAKINSLCIYHSLICALLLMFLFYAVAPLDSQYARN